MTTGGVFAPHYTNGFDLIIHVTDGVMLRCFFD